MRRWLWNEFWFKVLELIYIVSFVAVIANYYYENLQMWFKGEQRPKF